MSLCETLGLIDLFLFGVALILVIGYIVFEMWFKAIVVSKQLFKFVSKYSKEYRDFVKVKK